MDKETAERVARKPPFGAPHVFVLAVTEGAGDAPAAAVHRLDQPESVIGRGEDADFTVDDEEVSKHHIVIRVDGPVCTVSDLESLNGTSVNGRELRAGVAQRLRHLDEVQLGSTRLLFLSGRFRQEPKKV